MGLVKAGAISGLAWTDVRDAASAAGGTPALHILLLFLIFVSGAAFGKSKASSHVVNRQYVEALGVANRFLHAWQTQDHEGGLLMLSDEAKRRVSEDILEKFFSKPSNVAEAYEIERGKKPKAGVYVFRVALFEVVSGRKLHPRYSQVVVVRTGKDGWAIDKLP
jgi:hypothetical protein